MYGFGNWIVSTPPAGDSSYRIANTAFVANAIGSFTAFPTASSTGSVIYWNGAAWTALAGNSSGTQFLQETASGIPSWATISTAGTLVSVVTYSSTQTITIPATATKAFVRMWGASGGSGGVDATSPSTSGSSGAGGYLEKYLTGLTAGNTLAYTQGAAGSAGTNAPTNGGNGTASTLASGTQSITTLTANGSNGGTAGTGGSPGASSAGGTATNGDFNAPAIAAQPAGGATNSPLAPGMNLFSPGAYGVTSLGSALAGKAGNPGGLIIFWFT